MCIPTRRPSESQCGPDGCSREYAPQPIRADELPSEASLDACANLPVYDISGTSRPFRSLYENNGSSRRTLIVFVRHFFCGLCRDYVRALSANIASEELASLEFPTEIKIISCGSWELIKEYTADCNSHFPIYVDRDRKLHSLLSMNNTLELGSKPNYQSGSMLNVITSSIAHAIGSGTGMFKSGNYLQVGGEFLFHDGKLVWCHRMRATRDHTEIKNLRKLLELP